jgi:hypothetical protein
VGQVEMVLEVLEEPLQQLQELQQENSPLVVVVVVT